MRYWGLILGVLLALLSGQVLGADNEVLWQIGKSDNSYAEFTAAGKQDEFARMFTGGIGFEVGKSQAAKAWPYIQPGPDDKAWAGEGDRPYEVVFNLKSVPKGPFAVVIDLVGTNPKSPAAMLVRVNDKPQSFKLKAAGGEQIVKMCVGAGFLNPGRNVVNIRVNDGSYITYDSISFKRITKAPHPAEALALQPTILFKKRDGQLKQVVSASVDFYEDIPSVKTVLKSSEGWQVEQVFKNITSGHRELDVEFAPISKEQNVQLSLYVGDEVYKSECTVRPEKMWRIYMTPSSHFDYGYTDIQNIVMDRHIANLENAMEWCEKYPDWVWNTEAALVAQEYLALGVRNEQFINLAKEGRIGVMGPFGNQLTGVCSGEELSRMFDIYDLLRHTYGIESRYMMQTDVPSLIGTLPMILNEHGIKYLSHGINDIRGSSWQKTYNTPYYWESPDGSRVMVWKTGGYGQCDVSGMKDPLGTGKGLATIQHVLQRYIERADYPFDAILLHGAYGDNCGNSEVLAEAINEWNNRYEFPKLIPCRGREFFEHIEANFADKIQTVKGDGGSYWEDGVGSSAVETTAVRLAKEKLTTAEKLAALCPDGPSKELKEALTNAWTNILYYDEHTWGADISISHPYSQKTRYQWAIKSSFAENAAIMTDQACSLAFDRLCSTVKPSADSLLVFNPSSWSRSETIDFISPDGRETSVYAGSIPPLGYKLLPLSDAVLKKQSAASGDSLENKYYTIQFDKSTGAISSIYDKELKRELVAGSGYGLNAYLYVSGGEDSTMVDRNADTNCFLKTAACSEASLEKLQYPGMQVMRINSHAPMTRGMTSEIVLYDNEKRIDFVNNFDKIETLNKEGGYFAFPFAFDRPEIRIEIPNGVTSAEKDQFEGSCRDWYAAQHFVTISDGSAAVAWTAMDSPLLTLQDINRGQWLHNLDIKNGNLFAYVFNNYWWTNYKASQGGPMTFRFSMTSAASIDDSQAKRFGESVQSPMLCKILPKSENKTPVLLNSYVSVDNPGVVVQAVKPANYVNGTVLRLRNMTGSDITARVSLSGISLKNAYIGNLAEDKIEMVDVKDGVMEVPCRALGLATVILER